MSLNLKDVKDAEKKLTTKAEENYIVFDFHYNEIILKHSEGTKLMAALSSAERFKDSYAAGGEIHPLAKNDISMKLMSSSLYKHIKLAQLLNISSKELTDILEAKEEKTEEDVEL